jgi:hypothetical protein
MNLPGSSRKQCELSPIHLSHGSGAIRYVITGWNAPPLKELPARPSLTLAAARKLATARKLAVAGVISVPWSSRIAVTQARPGN